jgi:signal transduction histidine kinase
VRAQDLVLALLFATIAALSQDPWEMGMILATGFLQIAEPKIPFAATTPGKVLWIVLKLAIAYLLIGYTGGLQSSYYLFLMLPIISAANSLGLVPTLLFNLIACVAYLSFVLFVDWTKYQIDPEEVRVFVLRLSFLGIVGTLVNALAEALRQQTERYKTAAERLAHAEAAVRRAERLAALGQLSAGLAHEIRNPLGTIKGSAEMLARSVSQDNAVAVEMAGFISSEVDRTNSVVTRVLDFARPQSLKVEVVEIATVIDRAVELVERESPGFTVHRDYSRDLGPIPADAELMQHVFYNLLLNAVQASPQRGAVMVKTRKAARAAEIEVIDHGVGIEPKLIETIFNPFVTTKPTGVGLGLPIVAKIVDEHGGKIAVESEPGKGSTFRVALPLN